MGNIAPVYTIQFMRYIGLLPIVSLIGAKIGGPTEKQQEYSVMPSKSVVCEQRHSACFCGIAGKNILAANDLGNVRNGFEGRVSYTLNCNIPRRMLIYHFFALRQVRGWSGLTATAAREGASSLSIFSGKVLHFWVSLTAVGGFDGSVVAVLYNYCIQLHLV